MRSVESIADEMASLWARGARIFNFHDDNFFLPERQAMLMRVAGLGRALRERGVGRIAFAVKARPDAVDEEVFIALQELGLFRVFLGIEAGTSASLVSLGRRQTVEQNERALSIVNRLDVHTAFNLLLLNPDSTLEDVAGNVAFLRMHPDNPMNFCRTEVYAGTPLEKQLRRQGRLLGDYWGLDYAIADPRAELAFQLIYAVFHTRTYGDDCLHHLAMAVDYEHQLFAHFFGARSELRERVKRFIRAVNLDTADHLDAALAACHRGFGSESERVQVERALEASVLEDNRRLGAEGHALLDEIRTWAMRCAEPRGWGRTAQAVSLAAGVTLAAMGTAACGDSSHSTEMAPSPHSAPGGPSQMRSGPSASGPAPDAGVAQPSASVGSGTPSASAVPSPSTSAVPPASAVPSASAGPKPRPPSRPPTHSTEMVPLHKKTR